ncbi:MAG: hypothetical protein V4592_04605 [Bacteroidota bacterium]
MKVQHSLLKTLLLILFAGIQQYAYSQIATPADTLKVDSLKFSTKKGNKPADKLSSQYDVGDLFQNIFNPNKKADSLHKRSGITVIPNVAANPSIGAQIGIKAVAGMVLGSEPNTFMSVAATSASITTKGIIYFYVNHNIFTPGNAWNFQGSIVAAKTVTPDFGLGIGNNVTGTAADQALADASRKGYALHSYYFVIREKAYKEIQKNLFIGAGASFDIRRDVDEGKTATDLTPYNIYNSRHGFDHDGYASNGLLADIEYTTRDNQNRAYKGIYFDLGFRSNQTWLGSTKGDLQLNIDFRKYFSLSRQNPEHVIAFWNWGSYLLSGTLPYLELPGTGRDANFRSGRGYTVTYFKGTQYDYSEVEYRFPILKNKFISGVTFFNIQTANDEAGTKLFEKWQPGGGGGLRVLFNKATRTNLCLDYAWGKYGSRGFFLGLNEAF